MAKFIKSTLDTQFHIDFLWWQQKGKNLRLQLRSHACSECQERYGDNETFDWIDPETGEVFEIDRFWHCIYTECSHQTGFINAHTPLTTALFRAFMASNNTPMTSVELYEKIQKKSPDMILRTIGGRQVYQGIRPVAASR